MEFFVFVLGIVLIALPIAVVYLLVRASGLQRSIDLLNRRVDGLTHRHPAGSEIAHAEQPPAAEDRPEPLSEIDQQEQPPVIEPEPVKPIVTPTPALPETEPIAPIPATARENAGHVGYQAPAAAASEKAVQITSRSRSEPDFGDKLGEYIKGYFTEGNLIVRVGIIVLFFGVAFLLKYAADRNVFPIELRLAAVGLGGIVLLLIGWRLRLSRRVYALIMQGGGIGVLYLTMYAALRLYDLLPAAIVIVVMLLMVTLAAVLAVLQNASSLAVLAAVGGFLAPVLTSTGQGSHIVLFSYYLLLNIGILLIARYKSWRPLNLIGFGFTFFIGAAWGVERYQAEHYFSTQAFLIVFFLFYVALALLYARKQPTRLRGLVDGTLVFGTPLIAFTLQTGLVHDYEYGLAWSALAAGGFYMLLALQCWRFGGQNYRLLSEAFLALGVIFASLTIPFALDGNGIAAAWALEGAGILWISVRQRQSLGIAFGILLQLGGGLALLAEHTLKGHSQPVFNSVFIGAVLIALAGLFSSYYLLRKYREHKTWEYLANIPLLLWGLSWWFINGISEILEYESHLPLLDAITATVGFVALSVAALGLLENKLQWHSLRYAVIGLAVAMGLLILQTIESPGHPLAAGGYLVWPLAFAVFYSLLWQREKYSDQDGLRLSQWLTWLHAIGALMLVVLLTAECIWLVGDYWRLQETWQVAVFAVPALLAVGATLTMQRWPISSHRVAYLYWVAGLLLLGLLGWSVLVNIHSDGTALPLPYLPVLNPIDIMQAMVLLGLLSWWRQVGAQAPFKAWRPLYLISIAGLLFMWLNAMLLRSLHHWAGVPFSADGFYDSALTQASLSIFWTLLGLSVMVIATRRQWRGVWIAAAVLLGVVVLKLFSVDLADRNTLESIFSFIVVGVLLLVIGYYSPIPPGQKQKAELADVEE